VGPELSVVIPTRNEEGNVENLLQSLDQAFAGIEFETIFADDSTDSTADIVETASKAYRFDVRVLRRAERTGGLGGAVVDGIRSARAEYVVVMDADLQHPPTLAPVLYQRLRSGDADVVIASRYAVGGHAGGLAGKFRHLASRSATLLVRAVFPRRLRACTDPMTGFFCVRVSALDLGLLQPQGFKILLEMMVRSSLRVAEVPMAMGSRAHGRSKADLREAVRFVRQLFILRFQVRAARFALVGLTGAIWNIAIVAALSSDGVGSAASTIIAVQIATAWNFVGTEVLVFQDRRARTWRHRAWAFELLGAADLLRLPFVLVLIRSGVGPVVATAMTLAAAFGVRYVLASRLIYRRSSRALVGLQATPAQGLELDGHPPSAYEGPSAA
jgi:dolichol-phosphate mannosyltransferase